MIIEKKFKPSFHKANSRYRGVTEHSQYTNFVLESAHDLLLLSHISTGNESTLIKGHEKEMFDNFVSIMTGDEEIGRSNLFTSSTLQKINKDRAVPVPGLESWSPLNGCTQTQNGTTFTLSSQGLQDPVGMYSTIWVEPGDKLYIRLKVRSNGGAPAFSFGSNNMRTNGSIGDTKAVNISTNQEFQIVDYVIHAQYAQFISLNINVHEAPNTLSATSIEVKDLEVHYFQESLIQAASFDTIIKPAVNVLEEKINSIR